MVRKRLGSTHFPCLEVSRQQDMRISMVFKVKKYFEKLNLSRADLQLSSWRSSLSAIHTNSLTQIFALALSISLSLTLLPAYISALCYPTTSVLSTTITIVV